MGEEAEREREREREREVEKGGAGTSHDKNALLRHLILSLLLQHEVDSSVKSLN